METLYCACCGRPFTRTSTRGPAPLYCSQDCRRQIDVRRRARLAAEARERNLLMAYESASKPSRRMTA